MTSWTDAYNIMTQKILINRMSLEVLRIQIENADITKKIQDEIQAVAKKKMINIVKLNDLYEQQLTEFTEIRQEQTNWIYSDLNELDHASPEFIELKNKLAANDRRIMDLLERIAAIEKSIPAEASITNYKVVMKNDSNCRSLDDYML